MPSEGPALAYVEAQTRRRECRRRRTGACRGRDQPVRRAETVRDQAVHAGGGVDPLDLVGDDLAIGAVARLVAGDAESTWRRRQADASRASRMRPERSMAILTHRGIAGFSSLFRSCSRRLRRMQSAELCLFGYQCMPKGDWATWVGSVGVVLTLILMLGLIERDRRVRRSDQAQRRKELLRSQAERVAGWPEVFDFGPGQRAITLNNLSDSVVYRVYIFLITLNGTGPSSAEELVGSMDEIVAVDVLPPGRWRVGVSRAVSARSDVRFAVELAFTDQSGNYWLRRANGALEELSKSADSTFAWSDAAPPRFTTLSAPDRP